MTFLRLVRASVLAAALAATALVSLGTDLSAAAAQAAAQPAAPAQAPADGRDASAAAVASYSLTQLMPVDPEASLGTLPNGLKFYVRQNAKPARRVELSLQRRF